MTSLLTGLYLLFMHWTILPFTLSLYGINGGLFDSIMIAALTDCCAAVRQRIKTITNWHICNDWHEFMRCVVHWNLLLLTELLYNNSNKKKSKKEKCTRKSPTTCINALWDNPKALIGLGLQLVPCDLKCHPAPWCRNLSAEDKRKKAAKMSPVDMNGYWKMTSNENFDEYMEALGRLTLHFTFIYSFYPCENTFLCWTRYIGFYRK